MPKFSTISEVKEIELNTVKDDRGALTSIEGEQDIPFPINRVFYMHNIIKDRGGHAHTDTDQLVVVTSGSVTLRLSDGTDSKEFILDDPTKGLYIPRMIFIEIYNISKDAVCMVLASTHYEMKKSLRNRDDYMKYKKENA